MDRAGLRAALVKPLEAREHRFEPPSLVDEMLEDPLFHETEGLPTVDSQLSTTRVFACGDSPDYFEHPDGRVVALDDGLYPSFADMPAAARIEEVPMTGPPQVQTDNAALTDEIIETSNQSKLVGPSPSCAVSRVRPEAVLGMLALFGLAWLHRAPRRD